MFRNKSILIGALGNWFALLATMAVSLLLTPYLIHMLGEDVFGVWTLLVSILAFYGMLELGISSAISRYTAYYLGQKDISQIVSVFSTALVFFVGTGIVCVLVSLLAARQLAVFFSVPAALSGDFSRVILLLGFSAGISFISNIYLSTLKAHEFFLPGNVVRFFSESGRGICMALAVKSGYGLVSLAWITLAVSVFSLAGHMGFVRFLIPAVRFSAATVKKRVLLLLLAYGLPAALTVVAELMRTRFGSIIIGKYLVLAQITVFSIGARLATFLIEFMVALSAVFDPRFCRLAGEGDDRRLRNLYLRSTNILTAFSCVVGVSLIWEGQALINLWVGPGFVKAYPVLVILTAGHMLAASQMPSISLLFALNRHRILSVLAITEGLVNIAVSLLLVGRWGIEGVAFGTLAGIVLVKVLFLPVYTSRFIHLPFRRFAMYFFRPFIISVLAGIPFILFLRPESVGWILFLVYGFVFFSGMILFVNRFGLEKEFRLDIGTMRFRDMIGGDK